MPRRITRQLSQIGGLAIIILALIFFADTQYRLLPDSIHSALPLHHAGSVVTDVTIQSCSSVNVLSNCRLDPEKWHRIEQDLLLGAGWVQSSFLHLKVKKEEELSSDDEVVLDVRISRTNPGLSEDPRSTAVWEKRPGGIWLRRSKKNHNSESEKVVTGIDVLFGTDAVDPRPGWNIAQTPLLIDGSDSAPLPRLTVHHGRPKVEHREDTVPRVGKDGKFKILQISDAHLATGTGVCRDAIGPNGAASTKCEADTRTLEFIESVLDDEKPDLVVLSGDQVEGPAAHDTKTAILKMVAPLIERSIPWAAIFGNHDDEAPHSLPRVVQMNLLQNLPFSLSEPGPRTVDGVGNYYVEILAPSPSQHSAITIYLLDTHGLSPDDRRYPGYDWLKQNQIDWFRSTAEGLRSSHDKYSHIHLDMAFIHIPLPEYADPISTLAGGQAKESITAPGLNTHFYDALVEHGIVTVGCGHDHVNDFCALRPHDAAAKGSPSRLGPWMCYAGGSGFGGYAGYGGFHRRVRLWEVDTNTGSIVTWKRVECCGADTRSRIDEMILVEGGVAVEPF